MIRSWRLTKRYGTFEAVSALDLDIAAGEIFGFIGPNGAGKTTTIKMLAGSLQPTDGRIQIGGIDLLRRPEQAKALTGVIPDRPFLYEKLSAQEFLGFLAGLRSINGAEARRRIDELLEFFELSDWRHALIESFSHGMKQRMAIAGALLHRPSVLIVDEPMVGLDPRGARRIKDLFVTLAQNGTTIFLSTHSLDVAETICHRIGVIQHGRLIAVGPLDELKSRTHHQGERLEEVFLTLVHEEVTSPTGGFKS